MHRLSLITIFLLSSLSAQEYTFDPLIIDEEEQNIFQTQRSALDKNAYTLQERLEHDISFDTVEGEKNGAALSFRGIDDRATGYYEDGIPLYRTVSGEVATFFHSPEGSIRIYASSPSGSGVSSMGADVDISTPVPIKPIESTLSGSLSNNDNRFRAYVGSRIQENYVILNASSYRIDSFTLSDSYSPTAAQPGGERLNSDKKQRDVSFKAGRYLGSHGHVAAKIATSHSEFGVPHNVHVDTSAAPWTIPPDSYTRVNQKDLESFYLYGDYVKGSVETTLRLYHDRYQDIYDWYETSAYDSFLFPSSLYDDTRTGMVLRGALNSSTHTDTLILQSERNTHQMLVNDTAVNDFKSDTVTLSYVGEYTLSPTLQAQGALTYRLLHPQKELSDKKLLDYQLKVTQKHGKDDLYLAASHKSRFPSMDELFDFFGTANETLKPEQSRNLEAGYTYRPGAATTASVEGYYYAITDLIVKPGLLYLNENKATHYGTEIRLQTERFPNHRLSGAYRYAHAKQDSGERLELIPTHRLTFEERYEIAPGFSASMAYRYTSARYSSYLGRQYRLDPYSTMDLYLSYVRNEGMSYRFGVKNLLDQAYEWRYGYPAQGRSVFASLEWKL